jgi:hypothetical protein
MRILLISDIHGETRKLESILSEASFDSVLCAGDLSDAEKFGDYESILGDVLTKLDEMAGITKAVPGNMDLEDECVDQLIGHRMNIHKKIDTLRSVEVLGFGGGRSPFNTPFEPSDEEIRTALNALCGRMQSDKRALAVHMPPKNTELDIVDEDDHVGSQAVRDVIENHDFDVVVTGHIHESRGTEVLNGSHVVNPGPVAEGMYAVYDTETEDQPELKTL